jgi:hypothetical protein
VKDELIFDEGASAHSAGFEPGTQGWIIRSDGTAEFGGQVDVYGFFNFYGQGIFLKDNAYSAIIHDVDDATKTNGALGFYQGGFATKLTCSHTSATGSDDSGWGEVYLYAGDAFIDPWAQLTAYASDNLAQTYIELYADGPSVGSPRIRLGVDGTEIVRITNLGLALQQGGDGIDVPMSSGDGGDLRISGGANLFNMYWSDGPDDGSEVTLRIFGNNTDTMHLDLLDGDLTVAGQINPAADIVWSGGTQPSIVMDSTGSGDTWTSQGAHIVLGEQAANRDTAAAAVHITYNGGGIGHIGMGALDSTGKPAYGLKWLYTKAQTFAINDGSESEPFWTYDSDRDTGRYRKGTNEMADATAATDRWLIGTYGVKISTSLDILPRSDNTSQLGASGARYIDVWAVDTSINSSDERIKHDLKGLPLDAMQFVRDTTPVSFVRDGGKREHYGWTAQQIKAAMDAQGVDWGAYVDPAAGGVPEGKREEDGFGHGPLALRQAELVPVLWQAVQELEQRVATLEAAR